MTGTGQESHILTALALVTWSPVTYQRYAALLAIPGSLVIAQEALRSLEAACLADFPELQQTEA